MRKMLTLAAVLVVTTSTLSADWNPELAARYLDGRQKEWFSWKPAMSADGPCVSCHTGMTYLLARPALRRRLKESQPTMYEVGLLDRLRAKVGEKPAGGLQGVETIFSAMFLSREDVTKTMSAHSQKAFDQLWALQARDGASKGGWRWYAANLDPWENTESGRLVHRSPRSRSHRHPTTTALRRQSASSQRRFRPISWTRSRRDDCTIASRCCLRARSSPTHCDSRSLLTHSASSRQTAAGRSTRSARGWRTRMRRLRPAATLTRPRSPPLRCCAAACPPMIQSSREHWTGCSRIRTHPRAPGPRCR